MFPWKLGPTIPKKKDVHPLSGVWRRIPKCSISANAVYVLHILSYSEIMRILMNSIQSLPAGRWNASAPKMSEDVQGSFLKGHKPVMCLK